MRKVVLVAILIVAVILVAVALGRSGGDHPRQTSAPPTTTSASQPPAPDDRYEDKGWSITDVQGQQTQYGTAVSGRVTNNSDHQRFGVFTITVYGEAGQRLGQTQGSANGVGPGKTITVTFLGFQPGLPGDPASWSYEFQTDVTN